VLHGCGRIRTARSWGSVSGERERCVRARSGRRRR
jgi:hypothetical protein